MSNITLFFYPRRPDIRHSIWRIADILDIKISTSASKWDIGFLGNGDTHCLPLVDQAGRVVINGSCTDISKSYVNTCFVKTFGYSLEIDPLTHKGRGVRKSEFNYRHDGKIIEFPISKKEKDVVYNKLINSVVQDNLVEDIRVPIIGKKIPLVFLRYRPAHRRFSNHDSYVCVQETSDCFSLGEINKILDFCRELKLDFGELDVLRNKDENGLLYIVDANRTPASPPRKLSFFEGQNCMHVFSKAFLHEFFPYISVRNEKYELARYLNRIGRWIFAFILALCRFMKGQYRRILK